MYKGVVFSTLNSYFMMNIARDTTCITKISSFLSLMGRYQAYHAVKISVLILESTRILKFSLATTSCTRWNFNLLVFRYQTSYRTLNACIQILHCTFSCNHHGLAYDHILLQYDLHSITELYNVALGFSSWNTFLSLRKQ